MLYVGVNPGKNGGIAILTEERKLAGIWSMPFTNRQTELDENYLNNILKSYPIYDSCTAVIEQPCDMPEERMPKFNKHFSKLKELVLKHIGHAFIVSPSEWKLTFFGKFVNGHSSIIKAYTRTNYNCETIQWVLENQYLPPGVYPRQELCAAICLANYLHSQRH